VLTTGPTATQNSTGGGNDRAAIVEESPAPKKRPDHLHYGPRGSTKRPKLSIENARHIGTGRAALEASTVAARKAHDKYRRKRHAVQKLHDYLTTACAVCGKAACDGFMCMNKRCKDCGIVWANCHRCKLEPAKHMGGKGCYHCFRWRYLGLQCMTPRCGMKRRLKRLLVHVFIEESNNKMGGIMKFREFLDNVYCSEDNYVKVLYVVWEQ
jgi:hypothetical protein